MQKFFTTWYEKHFVPTITEELDSLMTYTEPFLPRCYHQLPEEGQKRFNILKERYEIMGALVMTSFSTYFRFLNSNALIPKLPLGDMNKSVISNKIPLDIINISGYTEFLDKVLAYGKQGIREFAQLREEFGLSPEED
jgi:hypothetical protein